MKLFRRMHLLLIAVLIAVLISSAVSALDISSEAVDKVIDSSDNDISAHYKLTITNTDTERHTYRLDSPDFRWRLRTSPLSDYFSGFTLGAGQSKEVDLFLTPAGDIFFGIYGVIIKVRDETGNLETISLPVEYLSPYAPSLEYAPTVLVDGTVNNNDKIDPRENAVLTIELDNRNPLNISRLEVYIESDFITENFVTTLKPLEKKKIEFNFNVDPQETPRVEMIRLTLRYRNNTLSGTPKSFPVQVISYSEILRNPTEESDLLRTKVRKTIFLKNEGNVDNRDTLRVQTSFFKRLFTSTSPQPKYERGEEGQLYAVWDIELAPASTAEIMIEVNYRPIFYVLGIGIIAVILYFLMRSPVVVKKTAASVDAEGEGISELKILIHIRNRTNNAYNTFSISEYVPKIANYMKSDMLGSIQPSKVLSHERKGTLLKWNFEAIEPFEERIIIYKVRLNLTVLGHFSMPATTVKFKDEANGSYTVRSNKLRINNIYVRDKDNKKSP